MRRRLPLIFISLSWIAAGQTTPPANPATPAPKPATSQQPPPLAPVDRARQEAQAVASGLARQYDNWGPDNSYRSATLTISEVSHSDGTYTYRLIADGLAHSGVYSLLTWPITQKSPSMALKGVTLNADGVVVCSGKPDQCGSKDKPDDVIELAMKPAPGEPFRVGLLSVDGTKRVMAKIVPIPIRNKDQTCSVEAILLAPAAQVVYLSGEGFTPGSMVTLVSDTEGEHEEGVGKADKLGRLTTVALPSKEGLDHGTTTVTLKAAACAPSISFAWGAKK